MRTLLLGTLLAPALLAGSATAVGSDRRYIGVEGADRRPVVGAPHIGYWLASDYIVTTAWKAAKAKPQALTRKYASTKGCRFEITVTARAVADADATARDRVRRLLPATGLYLRDHGTHARGAWRITTTDSKLTTGLLTKPGPTVLPRKRRVWLELSALAVPSKADACSVGRSRIIAEEMAVVLQTASITGGRP